MDQLVRVAAVARKRGDSERDRDVDRLARGVDLELVLRNGAPDPLADGERSLRFNTIRAIARRSPDSALVTLRDGRQIVLSGGHLGDGNRGAYVDDSRYGRVLVSWGALENVEFTPAGSGPAYDDFPPGGPLRGSVTTRAGRRLAGRRVPAMARVH